MSAVNRPRPGLLPLLALQLAVSRSADPNEERSLFKGAQDVTSLYPETFDEVVVKDTRPWVIDFYADWCGHCIRFAPVFKTMAAAMKDDTRVRFGALNCAVYSDFCSTVAVRAYPTIRAFHFPGYKSDSVSENGGENVDRKEFRSADKFVGWAQAHMPSGWSPPPRATAAPAAAVPADLPPAEPGTTAASAAAPAAGSGTSNAAMLPQAGAAGNASGATAAAAPDAEGLGEVASEAEKRWVADLMEEVKARPVAAQHLWDAQVVLLLSLRQGSFLQASQRSGEPVTLKDAPLAELCRWLEFVAGFLPSAAGRRDVARAAVAACQASRGAGRLEQPVWAKVLEGLGIDDVPAKAAFNPGQYWAQCSTYTCGLWSLFHVLTVAAAQGGSRPTVGGFLGAASAGDAGDAAAAPVQAQDVLVRIRGFVANFFGCEACVEHFLRTFDSCELGRCALAPGDGRGRALWLWQVHNHVAQRVAGERGSELPEPWPFRGDCPSCWTSDGLDDQAVYRHLRSVYLDGGGDVWSLLDPAQSFALFVGLAAFGFCAWRGVSHSLRHGKTT